MADTRAEDILKTHDNLKGVRGNWDTLYQEVADRVWPQMSDFITTRYPGEKRNEKVFDSTAILALEKFGAILHSLLTPDNQLWHRLTIGEEKLSDNHPIKIYLDEVTKRLFALRRSPFANFSSQVNECYKSLGAFGTMGMLIEDVPGRGLRYKSCHLGELYIAENQHGQIDYVHRCFSYTARQAVQAFGIEKVPSKVKDAYEKKDVTSKFEFIHCVKPNEERNTNLRDYANMAFASYYVACDGKQVVDEGGYRTFPYAISRYATSPKEVYGRGPAIMVLPDIKMVNEMEKTILRAGHMAVDPPLLLFEDGALQSFQMRPRALNYGGVDDQGRQLVRPLETGAKLPWAVEMTDAKRGLINDAFLISLFQILVENPQMTATQALLRAQEKGQLFAPTMGRQQSEFLGTVITRELDIVGNIPGALPDMPQELLDAGGFVEVEYTSPLSRLMRSEDGVAILNTIEQLAPIAQIDPSVFDIFDFDALPKELAEINGVPAIVMLSQDQLAAKKQAKAAAIEQAQMLEAAPVAASAAKDLASAAATAQAIPAQVPA